MQWQSILEALSHKLRPTRLSREIKTSIKCENDLMSYLLTDQEVRKIMSLWLEERYNNRVFKSLEKAKVFKTVGNKEFQAKNYSLCIRSYTKSALYAPSDSEYLSIAIANRSASLFYLDKYEDCIKDIELAIKLEYPEKLRYKLYLRAVQCYIKLGKRKLANDTLLQLREMINNCDDIPDIKKEDIEKQLGQLTIMVSCMQDDTESDTDDAVSCLRPELSFGENSNFPSASAGIECKYAPDKGRYVVANRDIKKGQTLFVEKPFVFVLLNHDISSGLCEHCCHSYGDVPIPCTMCLDTLYCNMKCWSEGWSSYHRWECPGSQMGLWEEIGIAHLAFKLLLACTTTTDRVRFNETQKLVTNFDKVCAGDLVIFGVTASMLTLYLSKYTDFFEVNDLRECLMSKFSDEATNFKCDISTEGGKRLYVSSLLLRHLLQLASNAHAITKLSIVESVEEDDVSAEKQERIATAIYLSASMMNHSCDPNIINSFMDQYLIVKATKDIAAGEEVLSCYGPHFRRMSKEQRQEILKGQYGFTCKCEPCTVPEFQYFMDRFNAMKCPECSGALYSVHGYSVHCLDCGATPPISYQSDIKQAQELFDEARICIELEKNEEEILDILKQCLSIRRTVLYKYHKDISATLDLIGRVYAIMGRWLDSISYLEHSIAIVGERFGASSIELANELNKLTDICIRYLREEPNTTTKWYKNILKKTRRYLDRAEEIINLNYGPWNDAFCEIAEKKKVLSVLLKDFNI